MCAWLRLLTPQRASDVLVCRPLKQCRRLPGGLAAAPHRFLCTTLYVSLRLHSCLLLALSSEKARVAGAGRYEVTRARPSRRLVEEVGMGLAASTLLVRPRRAAWQNLMCLCCVSDSWHAAYQEAWPGSACKATLW